MRVHLDESMRYLDSSAAGCTISTTVERFNSAQLYATIGTSHDSRSARSNPSATVQDFSCTRIVSRVVENCWKDLVKSLLAREKKTAGGTMAIMRGTQGTTAARKA